MINYFKTIEVKQKVDSPLPAFKWENIPQLSVITGVNGSGKTQFLNLINQKISSGGSTPSHIIIDNVIREYEFGFIPWTNKSEGMETHSYTTIQSQLDSFSQNLKINQSQIKGNLDSKRLYEILNTLYGFDVMGKEENFYKTYEFKEKFREAWSISESTNISRYITRFFTTYIKRFEEERDKIFDGMSENDSITKSQIQDQILKKVGERPWETINKTFLKYDFKYRINHPTDSHENFNVKFYKEDIPDKLLLYNQLSSGEQMIVRLISWTFSEKIGDYKKVILLDEPDAHLHPQMSKMFKEIISDILVKKLNIQIILTTHSPTTLCWFEEESIFLMDPIHGIVQTSKSEAINKLTSGMVFVQETTDIVLVEGPDDADFHPFVLEQLTSEKKLSLPKKLIFKKLTVSNEGGKKDVIKYCNQWLHFGEEITGFLKGIVDKDNDDNSNLPKNVFTPARYSIENYLYDPMVVFFSLIEHQNEECLSIIKDTNFKRGDEGLIRTGNSSIVNYQFIADFMCEKLKNNNFLNDSDLVDTVKCPYVNGITVKLPKQILSKRGKDLMLAYNLCFSYVPNRKYLKDTISKTLMVPEELKTFYKTNFSTED